MWQFPNCEGSVDNKHVAVTPPRGAGSCFYNYQHFHSMLLMAIAKANCELLYSHFGTDCRVSAGGVMENTQFHQTFCDRSLKLPGPRAAGSNIVEVSPVQRRIASKEAEIVRHAFKKRRENQSLTSEMCGVHPSITERQAQPQGSSDPWYLKEAS
ncbi:hypothetical protein RRG08_038431 [Elysia crispata]|uniref:DDE Tnp4 domain-containing protein n=1 Tax=Elysia crispata TaxID=231223 RepID=A0AAE1E1Q2_9GAST|nr:hypothetical protein RRG08_038431 [Elysia crispata]